LYFVGLPFPHGFYSRLIGGVTRGADYVAGLIAQRMPNKAIAFDTVPAKKRTVAGSRASAARG
jgi:hypothetical protein